jgi:hypothetical protein
MLQPPLDIRKPNRTLAEASQNALVAVSGQVVSLSRGFYGGFPGVLVGFRISDKVAPRGQVRPIRIAEPADVRYTFVGEAQFTTPDGNICSATGNKVPIPQLGDSILLFSFFAPSDEAGLILPIAPSYHLVVERGTTRVFTPVHLREGLHDALIPDAMQRIRALGPNVRSQH